MGVEREDDQKRKTTLCEKLAEALKTAQKEAGTETALSLTEENWDRVDPMIGMAGITPYTYAEEGQTASQPD